MATVTAEITTADTGASPNASGAFTPAVDDLLVVFVATSGATTEALGNQLTSSAGYTFTGIELAGPTSTNHNIFLYVANSLVTSATSQTVTWTHNTDGATGTVICVAAVAGMTRTGTGAVRQTAVLDDAALGTTPQVVFASACLTGNPVLGAVVNQSNPAAMTVPSSWSEGGDTGYNTPTTGCEWVYIDSGFTSDTVTWGSTSATRNAAMAVELDSSVPSSTFAGWWGAGGLGSVW